MAIKLAVDYLKPDLESAAVALACELGLPLARLKKAPLLLQLMPVDVTPGYRLQLQQTGKAAPGPVYVEFVEGTAAHRLRYGGGTNQALARAIGIKGRGRPTVLDATVGLGRDAFVLASIGCPVVCCERSRVVHALLQNGLQRAAEVKAIRPIVERIHLLQHDAIAFTKNLPAVDRPDVIYLDPMFPQRSKSALVKKEMRLLQSLIGDDEDADQLLSLALKVAHKRVVVKRPRLARPLAGREPHAQINGKSTRYDLYPVV